MVFHPLVSVGIPTFNNPTGLRSTIDCIVNQTYKNLEIIISDNCSSNNEVEKIGKEYEEKDKRIKYIKQSKNIGAHLNFKYVLGKASGKYFMWAADDDLWKDCFIYNIYELLEKSPEAGVGMCATERIREDGTLFDVIRFQRRKNPNNKSHLNMALSLMTPVKYNLYIYGIFKTQILKDTIQALEETAAGERWFLIHFSLVAKFVYIDEILYTRTVASSPWYKRYPDDRLGEIKLISQKKWFNFKPICKIYKTIRKSNLIPRNRKIYLPILIAYLYYRSFLNGLLSIKKDIKAELIKLKKIKMKKNG